jgi:hypothetical protein
MRLTMPVKLLAVVAVGLILAAGLCLFHDGPGGDLCALHLAIVTVALLAAYLTTVGRPDLCLASVPLRLLPDLPPPPPKA